MNRERPAPAPDTYMTKQVTIGNTTIAVQIADTDEKRQLGLSGRASLNEGEGMLFIFDEQGELAFWMKDMLFTIDIIFADQDGKVVTIYKEVSPESYLKSPPEVFTSDAEALYVLEVPAGFAEKHGISQNSKIIVE